MDFSKVSKARLSVEGNELAVPATQLRPVFHLPAVSDGTRVLTAAGLAWCRGWAVKHFGFGVFSVQWFIGIEPPS